MKLARRRFYSGLAAGCLAAGSLGGLFDQVTVTVSPEYFLHGKGMDPVGLRLAVAWLGFRSALPLGAAVGGLGFLRASRVDRFTWSTWLATVAGCVALMLALCSAVNVVVDPFSVREAAHGALSPQALDRYLVAWGLHIGAYSGAVLGVVVAWRRAGARRPPSPG